MKQHPALSSFHFCPSCGSDDIQKMDGKLILCNHCKFDFYLNAAAAVGIFLRNAQGKTLLIRRTKEPSLGKLGIPGGFIDPEETIEEGLIREVQEEIDLDLSGQTFHYLCSAPNRYRYHETTYQTVDLYFTGILPDQQLIRPCSECDQILWLLPEEIKFDHLAFPSLAFAVQKYLIQQKTTRNDTK